MGTGIWANFHWENGIWVTGTGIWSLGMGLTNRKTIALGLGFLKFGKTVGWENGIWAKFGLGKWDSYPPSGLSCTVHCLPPIPSQTLQSLCTRSLWV